MRHVLLAALLVAMPAAASAAMSVETFLTRADALKKKGLGALFSGDIKRLRAEAEGAGAQLKAERLATIAAGKRPGYCPPPKASVGSNELLGFFRAMPPVERARLSVKDGIYRLMVRKYPCA